MGNKTRIALGVINACHAQLRAMIGEPVLPESVQTAMESGYTFSGIEAGQPAREAMLAQLPEETFQGTVRFYGSFDDPNGYAPFDASDAEFVFEKEVDVDYWASAPADTCEFEAFVETSEPELDWVGSIKHAIEEQLAPYQRVSLPPELEALLRRDSH